MVFGVQAVLNAMIEDTDLTPQTQDVVAALRLLYRDNMVPLRDAIDTLLTDGMWSRDREPYAWLESIRAAL
jgi:hypothetical protein